ncbi:MAG: IS5 family insertion sequence transposase protein [Magnetococcales bacterium]|nr:IS5 family insertion sequence transposase protein [Magnetococcales bacterium]
MDRLLLRDDQWEQIVPLLPKRRGDQRKIAEDYRLFIEAVLWVVRTGSPWRDLPAPFGKWSRVYKRFSRWVKNGTWKFINQTVINDPDLEALMVDSTIVRAHQHAAGAEKKTALKPLAGPKED